MPSAFRYVNYKAEQGEKPRQSVETPWAGAFKVSTAGSRAAILPPLTLKRLKLKDSFRPGLEGGGEIAISNWVEALGCETLFVESSASAKDHFAGPPERNRVIFDAEARRVG